MPAGDRVASGVSGMSLDGRYRDDRRREEDDLEDTRRRDELGDRLEQDDLDRIDDDELDQHLEEEDLGEQLYDDDLEQAFDEDERVELVRDDREEQREEDERRRHKEQQAKQREAGEQQSDAENAVDAVGVPAGAALTAEVGDRSDAEALVNAENRDRMYRPEAARSDVERLAQQDFDAEPEAGPAVSEADRSADGIGDPQVEARRDEVTLDEERLRDLQNDPSTATDRPVLPGQEPANAANRGQAPAGERWPAPSPDARRDLPGPENDAREAGEPDRGDLQRQAEQHDRDARPGHNDMGQGADRDPNRDPAHRTGRDRTGDPRAAQAQQAPQDRDPRHNNPRLDRAQGGAAAAAAAPGGNPPGPPGGPPRDPRAGGAAPADRQQQVDRRQQQQRHPGRSATKTAADLAQRASTKADAVIAMADPTIGASPRQSRAPGQGKGLEHLKQMMHGGQKRAGLAATPPTKTPEARAHKGQTAGAFIKQLREGRGGGGRQQAQDGGRERTNR